VTIGAGVVRVGSHQSLLDGEDEIVRGAQGCGGQWRIMSTQPKLKGTDRLTQWLRRLRVVSKTKHFDVIQERVGLC
jgi:hypothetical protein